MAGVRPVSVIAALDQEAHALVRRMPRSESVGPRISSWEGDGLVVMVAGVGKVAAAIAAQYAWRSRNSSSSSGCARLPSGVVAVLLVFIPYPHDAR